MRLFFFRTPQPLVGHGLRTVWASGPHSDTPLSVGILWTSDQPVVQTYDKTQLSKEADIYATRGIRTRIPNKRTTADPLARPRGYRNRRLSAYGPGNVIHNL